MRRLFVVLALGGSLGAAPDPEEIWLFAQTWRTLESRADEITRPFPGGRFPLPAGTSNAGLVRAWLYPALLELKWRGEAWRPDAPETKALAAEWKKIAAEQSDLTARWMPLMTNRAAGVEEDRLALRRAMARCAESWTNHRRAVLALGKAGGLRFAASTNDDASTGKRRPAASGTDEEGDDAGL